MKEAEPGPNQFRCDQCGEIADFDPSWTDEDARREALANGFDPDQCDRVCDACFDEEIRRLERIREIFQSALDELLGDDA